jgi:hypothetical protein
MLGTNLERIHERKAKLLDSTNIMHHCRPKKDLYVVRIAILTFPYLCVYDVA